MQPALPSWVQHTRPEPAPGGVPAACSWACRPAATCRPSAAGSCWRTCSACSAAWLGHSAGWRSLGQGPAPACASKLSFSKPCFPLSPAPPGRVASSWAGTAPGRCLQPGHQHEPPARCSRQAGAGRLGLPAHGLLLHGSQRLRRHPGHHLHCLLHQVRVALQPATLSSHSRPADVASPVPGLAGAGGTCVGRGVHAQAGGCCAAQVLAHTHLHHGSHLVKAACRHACRARSLCGCAGAAWGCSSACGRRLAVARCSCWRLLHRAAAAAAAAGRLRGSGSCTHSMPAQPELLSLGSSASDAGQGRRCHTLACILAWVGTPVKTRHDGCLIPERAASCMR